MPEVADVRLPDRRSSASTRPPRACRGSSTRSGARTATTAPRSSRRSQTRSAMPQGGNVHAADAGAVRHRRRVVRARPAAARPRRCRPIRRRRPARQHLVGGRRRTSPRWRPPAGARSTATNMMAMFGCGAATDPRAVPRRRCRSASTQPYGTGWDCRARHAARAQGRHVPVRRTGRAARPMAASSRTASTNVHGSYDHRSRSATRDIADRDGVRPRLLPRQLAASCSRAAIAQRVRDERARRRTRRASR